MKWSGRLGAIMCRSSSFGILGEGSQLAGGTLYPRWTIQFVFGFPVHLQSLLHRINAMALGLSGLCQEKNVFLLVFSCKLSMLCSENELHGFGFVGLLVWISSCKKLYAWFSCESSVHSYKNELHCGIGSTAAEELCRIVCPSAKSEWESANTRRCYIVQQLTHIHLVFQNWPQSHRGVHLTTRTASKLCVGIAAQHMLDACGHEHEPPVSKRGGGKHPRHQTIKSIQKVSGVPHVMRIQVAKTEWIYCC